MKHIKKYRLKFTDQERNRFMSRARIEAKTIISKKYLDEYHKILKRVYRRIERDSFKSKDLNTAVNSK
jgi:hypothetical protein